MNRIHRARAAKGKLHFLDRQAFDREVAALGDCLAEVIVRKYRPNRSLGQNAFYNGVLLPTLSEYTGYDRTELHHELKRRFIEGRSTADLNISEFCQFIEDCQRLGAELGCVIPDQQSVEV